MIASGRHRHFYAPAGAWLLTLISLLTFSQVVFASDPASSRETQQDAVRRLPLQQLNRESRDLVNAVIENPSFFRRMPSTAIDCDPEMYQHLVRHPEVLVNIWDVMGITKVEAKRTGPYTFNADDGVGTICKCDLVFGNENVHVYYGSGYYKGSMAPRQINGRCVCVLYNVNTFANSGDPIIRGSMDVFLKLDNLGADLLTRTLGPLVGKTADNNFTESAKFLAQVSQVCEYNPAAAQALANRLNKVQPEVRDEFARIAARIGHRELEMQELLAGKLPPTDLELPGNRRSISDATVLELTSPAKVPAMRFSDSPSTAMTKNQQSARNSTLQPPASPDAPKRNHLHSPLTPKKPNVYMRR
jgi:hypothetical protein